MKRFHDEGGRTLVAFILGLAALFVFAFGAMLFMTRSSAALARGECHHSEAEAAAAAAGRADAPPAAPPPTGGVPFAALRCALTSGER